jgi:hypothetical protein
MALPANMINVVNGPGASPGAKAFFISGGPGMHLTQIALLAGSGFCIESTSGVDVKPRLCTQHAPSSRV